MHRQEIRLFFRGANLWRIISYELKIPSLDVAPDALESQVQQLLPKILLSFSSQRLSPWHPRRTFTDDRPWRGLHERAGRSCSALSAFTILIFRCKAQVVLAFAFDLHNVCLSRDLRQQVRLLQTAELNFKSICGGSFTRSNISTASRPRNQQRRLQRQLLGAELPRLGT
jgi:hypothetical protein